MGTAEQHVGDPAMSTKTTKVFSRRTIARAAARVGLGLVAGVAGILVASSPGGATGVASIVVSATQPAGPIAPGQSGISTITVTDTGTKAQLKTKITIQLPAAVAGQPTVMLTAAAGVSCAIKTTAPFATVCKLGRIPAGASAAVGTLTATAPSDTGSGLSTSATVAGPTNAVAVSFQWSASLATLVTSVSLNPGTIELGQFITGTLTVTNTGIGAAGPFAAYVPLPSSFDPETVVSEPAGTICTPFDGLLQCPMPGLAPGASIVVVWKFQPQSGPSAQVTATADVQNIVPQTSRVGDVATSNTVAVTGTGAVLTVTSSNVAATPQGSNFSRTLTVTNSGDTPAFGTVVADWSGWFNYLGAVGGANCAQFTIGVGGKGGSHPVRAGTDCAVGTVPAGGSVSVTFSLEVPPSQAATTYSNKIVVKTATPGGSSTQGTSVIKVVVPSSPVSPALLSPPGVPSGHVIVGDTLATGNGAWNGTPTIGFTYQWMNCDATGLACAPIPAATGNTYVVQASDIGSTIDCVVTATNGGGSATVTTPITVPAGASVAPSVVSLPTVSSGEPVVGALYYGATGTWTGTPDITYAFQWYVCDASGTVCTAIAGATGPTYVLTAADNGQFIQVWITATNSGGSSTARSNLATTAG